MKFHGDQDAASVFPVSDKRVIKGLSIIYLIGAKTQLSGYCESMATEPLDPDSCLTMAEVRQGVDAIDQQLCRLIGTRFGYMRAAARIKPERGLVRDEGRKAQVIDNARRAALAFGWPPDAAADLWEVLVEASIAYEFDHFDGLADDGVPPSAGRQATD